MSDTTTTAGGARVEAALAKQHVAGFWIRVASDVLDALFLAAFGYLLSLPLRAPFLRLGERGVFIGLAISLAYAGLSQSKLGGGQTLAKRLLKLRVVKLDGSLLSVDRSLLRYATVSFMVYQGAVSLALARVLPFLRIEWISVAAGTIALVLFLGCVLVVPFHPLKRGLHDLLVGSIVVRGAPPSPVGVTALSKPAVDRVIVTGAAALLVVSTVIAFVLARPAAILPTAVAHPERLAAGVPLQNAQIVDTLHFGDGGRRRTVQVTGFLPTGPDGRPPDFDGAHRVLTDGLRRALADHADIDGVGTSLRTGFNIGIYSSYSTRQRLESLRTGEPLPVDR